MTLHPVAGCGRCADIVGAHLLGVESAYAMLAEHLVAHEYSGSIWPEVNDLAAHTGEASLSSQERDRSAT